MKKIHIFIAIFALLATFIAGPLSVSADYYNIYATNPNYVTYGVPAYVAPTYVNPYVNPARGVCVSLTSNLYKGLKDVSSGGQISALQSFLIANDYLIISAPTGYYGAATYSAVALYQSSHGLSANGIVDALTRNSIQTVSCGGGYNNGYQNGYNNYYTVPVLSSLSVTSGVVGTSVTIYGTGFDYSNNSVNFNGVALTNIPSYNGTSLTFNVPQVYNNYNNYNTYNNYNYNSGTYPVSVTTSRGTSNILNFTVYYSGSNNCYNNYNNYNYGYNYNNCNSGPLSVSNVSGPSSLSTGAQGQWSLSLNNPNSNYVTVSARWGDENTYNYGYSAQSVAQSSYMQGQQTLTFTHTYQTSGYYTVVFTATDNQGAQTTVSASVNVSGNYYNNQLQPTLSSISPSSGRVGTQVVLYGSGFTPTGNVVHFGNGGTRDIAASNGGNTIYYIIPNYISPCNVSTSGTYCPMYAQQITPGTYPIYVSNSYGQTSTLYYTVIY